MIKKLEVPDEYKKYISITLCLTSECNYKCWYCYQNNMERKTEVHYTDCIRFIKKVQKKYPEKEILVLLMGGETLYYNGINEIIETLYNMNIKIDITTNGSKPEKWWKKFGKMINNITISYHHKEVSKESFLRICKSITNNTIRHLTVALMLEPKYFTEIYDFGKKLTEEVDNLMVLIKPINNALLLNNFQNFTEEQLQIIKNNNKFKSKNINFIYSPFDISDIIITDINNNKKNIRINDIILQKKTNFSGMRCYAGIEEFFMNFDGSVYRANCLSGYLGNISDDIELPTEPIVCNKDDCYCKIDVQITKERI